MVKAVKGVLVQCDPSIKAIILKADAEKNEYIVEDLDDQTLVVKENQLAALKAYLDNVSDFITATCLTLLLMVL